MTYPKLGIRPTIDGRNGGVRESLEEKTMAMAYAAKELIGFITDKEKKAELLNQLNDAQNALNNKLSETASTISSASSFSLDIENINSAKKVLSFN